MIRESNCVICAEQRIISILPLFNGAGECRLVDYDHHLLVTHKGLERLSKQGRRNLIHPMPPPLRFIIRSQHFHVTERTSQLGSRYTHSVAILRLYYQVKVLTTYQAAFTDYRAQCQGLDARSFFAFWPGKMLLERNQTLVRHE